MTINNNHQNKIPTILKKHNIFLDEDIESDAFNIKCKIKGKDVYSNSIKCTTNNHSIHLKISVQHKTAKKFILEKEYKIQIDLNKLIALEEYKKDKFDYTFNKFILVFKEYCQHDVILHFTHPIIKLNSSNIQVFIKKKVEDVIKAIGKDLSLKIKTNLKTYVMPFIIQYYISYYDFLEYLLSHNKGVILPNRNGTIAINTIDTFNSKKAIFKSDSKKHIVSVEKEWEQINTFSYYTNDFDINNPLKPINLKKEDKKKVFKINQKTFHINKGNKSHYTKYASKVVSENNLKNIKYILLNIDLDLYAKVNIDKKDFFVLEKEFSAHKFKYKGDDMGFSFKYTIVDQIPILPLKDYKIHCVLHAIVWDDKKEKKEIPLNIIPKEDHFASFPVCLTDTNIKEAKKNTFLARNLQNMCNEKGGFMTPYRHGDEVVIGFLDGLPTKPVILGSLCNKKNPYPLKEKYKNQQGFIISTMNQKDKMSLLFDPTDKKETIETKFVQHYNLLSTDKSFFSKCQVKKKKTKIDNYIKEGEIENTYDKLEIKETYRELKLEQDIKKGTMDIQLEDGDFKYTIKKGDMTIKLDKGNLNLDISKSDMNLDCGDIVTIKSKKQIILDSEEIVLKGSKKIAMDTKDMEMKCPTSLKIDTGKCNIKGTQLAIKATKMEIDAPKCGIKGAQFEIKAITKITGQCDITGAFKVTGPSNLTGPVTIAPSLTCAMMTGNLMGNALTATKAITASALG